MRRARWEKARGLQLVDCWLMLLVGGGKLKISSFRRGGAHHTPTPKLTYLLLGRIVFLPTISPCFSHFEGREMHAEIR